jgi:Flp pilus assembly pilin Flp
MKKPLKTTTQNELLAKRRLLGDTRGANIVEYVILVGVVALVAVAGFRLFGTSVKDKISDQANAVGGINGAE